VKVTTNLTGASADGSQPSPCRAPILTSSSWKSVVVLAQSYQ
jgi:hypothetical protein